MPNWCSNHVIVEGKKATIENLLETARDKTINDSFYFSFNNVLPMPSNLKQGLDHNDWCYYKWGTKWDINNENNDFKFIEPVAGGVEGNYVFEMFYETAWSPALAFWYNVSQIFPDLQITQEFFEEGSAFIGQTYYSSDFIESVSQPLDTRYYVMAGAEVDENGYVDWDIDQEYDLWKCFPLDAES